MKTPKQLLEIGKRAKEASKQLRLVESHKKNQALKEIALQLGKMEPEILKANLKDLTEAKENGLNEAMLDRLSLQGGRLKNIISDVENVIRLPDPVGEIIEENTLPNGILLQKKRVSIGVLGIIYESRPNVTVDVATLALKTGNAAILRGGKETLHTNGALVKAIHKALITAHFPEDAIQLLKNKSRSLLKHMLKLDSSIDMIIPRGGSQLHRLCLNESTIPVITGGIGICHLFVDETADLQKSVEVIFNAKTQRPQVCNALDTLLVHRKIAKEFLPLVIEKLKTKNVTFRLDAKAWDLIQPKEAGNFILAKEEDWMTEWLSLILGIKIVDSLEEAITHIQTYSSNHSDGILTESEENGNFFIQAIDSAAVYVNASTRFTDGGQFGLGAEVAVSTQKLHARGPMGLKELTTYKWIAKGNYNVRD